MSSVGVSSEFMNAARINPVQVAGDTRARNVLTAIFQVKLSRSIARNFSSPFIPRLLTAQHEYRPAACEPSAD